MKLRDGVAKLQQIIKQQQKQEAVAAKDVVAERVAALLRVAPKVGDTTIVVAEMPDVPLDQLKIGADMIKQKCGSAAVLFGVWTGRPAEPRAPATDVASGRSLSRANARDAGKALLLAALTPDLIKRGLKSGDLVKAIAPIVEGGGGGPATMAQAGGRDPARLAEALDAGRTWIEGRLG